MKRQSRRPKIDPRVLNREEAAVYLGIGHTSLDGLVEEGIVNVIRYPGIRKDFFDRNELDGLIDRAKQSLKTLPTPLPTHGDKYGILRVARGGK